MKYLLSASLAILFLGLISSCEKQESFTPIDDINLLEEEDCFYNNNCISLSQPKSVKNKNEAQLTKAVKKWFQKNEEDKNAFRKEVGIPLWKENNRYENDNIELVYIPIVKKNEHQTNAFLIAFREKGKQTIKYKTILRQDIAAYRPKKDIENINIELSKEHVISQFLIFDHNLFNYTDCSLVKLLKKTEAKNCTREATRIYVDW